MLRQFDKLTAQHDNRTASPLGRGTEGVGTVDKHFTGDPDKKIFDEPIGDLPNLAEELKIQNEKLKIKYEKRKQIILKLKEFTMLNTLKKFVDFLLKYKNAVTNIAGFIFALATFVNEYLVSNDPNIWNLIMAVGVWIVAYFTGKSPLK